MNSENYKFYQNTKCEYFPCHKTDDMKNFNCLFCYCPLYLLKNECGGNFIKTNCKKNCKNCMVPHSEGSYERIMEKMNVVVKLGSDF